MKIKLSFLLLFFSIIIHGQSVNFGVGLSNEIQFFQHENTDQYANQLLKPYITTAFGLDLTVKIKRNTAFQFYSNLHLVNRQIALAYKYENYLGSVRAEGVEYSFATIDWSLKAAYLIKKKWLKIEPMLGFFLSGTQHIGTSEFSRTGGSAQGGSSTGSNLLSFDLNIDDIPFNIYAGITGGVVLQPTRNLSHPVELFIDFNYTPRNIFGKGILYQINYEDKNLNGKPHSIIIGVRIWLKEED